MSTETMQNAIEPKSDQINADEFPAGVTRTIRITKVVNKGGAVQPVSVFFEGDEGKPWKPCKSSCRVLVYAWGMDPAKYVGKSITLFGDPTVQYGGMAVGGIRISHMSDIDDKLTSGVMAVMLTEKRGSRKPFIVKPIKLAATVAPITAAPDKAAEWTEKLIAKIAALPHQDAAREAIATVAMGTRIQQLHESRPELEKAIYAAIDELPTNPDDLGHFIDRVNMAACLEDAIAVMGDPSIDALNADDASKLMSAYRAKWGAPE